MPRIQYRVEPFRCGWGAESAADRMFAGPSSWAMEAPAACDRTTIPAMASCETDPVIAMIEERKRAVAGTRNLRVIRPPAGGEAAGERFAEQMFRRLRAPCVPVYTVLPAGSVTSSSAFAWMRTLTTQREIPLLHFSIEEEQQSFSAFGRNPFFTPKMPVVCTGFAVRSPFPFDRDARKVIAPRSG